MSRPPFRPHPPAAKPSWCGVAGSALVLLLAGCTSEAGNKAPEDAGRDAAAGASEEPEFVGPPSRITWTLYKTGQQITLVNESHTNRLDFYSETRSSASTKVQTDEIVAALIEFLESEGFDRHASAGSAPAAAIGQVSQTLELEVDGRRRHMLWAVDRPEKERACFVACRDGLMEIWNATFAAQAVDNARGEAVFGTSKSTKPKGR